MKKLKIKYPMGFIDESFRHWTILEKRNADLPFYTVGKSAYLDGDTPEYHDNKDRLNECMFSCFSYLYEEVLDVISEHLNERVILSDKLAYPGFHVFGNCQEFVEMGGNWHQDIPHETLGLGRVEPMAFTLAMVMPEGGGGIDFKERGYVRHNVGTLILHDGYETHRIAPLKQTGSKSRITMQGHIIKIKGQLIAFW